MSRRPWSFASTIYDNALTHFAYFAVPTNTRMLSVRFMEHRIGDRRIIRLIQKC
jgi:hypothetical protein